MGFNFFPIVGVNSALEKEITSSFSKVLGGVYDSFNKWICLYSYVNDGTSFKITSIIFSFSFDTKWSCGGPSLINYVNKPFSLMTQSFSSVDNKILYCDHNFNGSHNTYFDLVLTRCADSLVKDLSFCISLLEPQPFWIGILSQKGFSICWILFFPFGLKFSLLVGVNGLHLSKVFFCPSKCESNWAFHHY